VRVRGDAGNLIVKALPLLIIAAVATVSCGKPDTVASPQDSTTSSTSTASDPAERCVQVLERGGTIDDCQPFVDSTAPSEDPCTWLSHEEVRDVIDRDIEPGSTFSKTSFPLCTYVYTSASGVSTDLVVGPWSDAVAEAIGDYEVPNHTAEVVRDLGDEAVFLKAASLDDGNNLLLVKAGRRSLLIGGEFVTREQAIRLADLVLTRWN
jgi:hypothetical protein